MLVKLPNGLLDGVDLFNYAEVDEIRGKQQNYLTNAELVVGNIGHIPKILEDLTLSLQTEQGLKWQGKISEAIWKLPSGDLETLLVKIRENTYGPKFLLDHVECPHCQHVNSNIKLMLNSLELDVLPIEQMLKPKTVLLTKSQLEVELKPLYLKDLFDIIKFTLNKKDTLVTSATATSVKRLGDKTGVKPEDFDQLPAMDLLEIDSAISEMKLEGTIDTMLQVDCQSCKKEFETKLNLMDPSFFYPSRGSIR